MSRKRFTAEQVIHKPRQAEVELANGLKELEKENQKQREGFTWIPKSGEIDKAAEERLRALGYLE